MQKANRVTEAWMHLCLSYQLVNEFAPNSTLSFNVRRRTLERDAYCVRSCLPLCEKQRVRKKQRPAISGQNIGLREATHIHCSPGQCKTSAACALMDRSVTTIFHPPTDFFFHYTRGGKVKNCQGCVFNINSAGVSREKEGAKAT